MPVHDVEEVLRHAFLKGSRRVGRSGMVKSEEKKVVLAVEAHIRHVHTQYESLLETGVDREEARVAVWDLVRSIKATWMGEQAVDVNQGSGSCGDDGAARDGQDLGDLDFDHALAKNPV